VVKRRLAPPLDVFSFFKWLDGSNLLVFGVVCTRRGCDFSRLKLSIQTLKKFINMVVVMRCKSVLTGDVLVS